MGFFELKLYCTFCSVKKLRAQNRYFWKTVRNVRVWLYQSHMFCYLAVLHTFCRGHTYGTGTVNIRYCMAILYVSVRCQSVRAI